MVRFTGGPGTCPNGSMTRRANVDRVARPRPLSNSTPSKAETTGRRAPQPGRPPNGPCSCMSRPRQRAVHHQMARSPCRRWILSPRPSGSIIPGTSRQAPDGTLLTASAPTLGRHLHSGPCSVPDSSNSSPRLPASKNSPPETPRRRGPRKPHGHAGRSRRAIEEAVPRRGTATSSNQVSLVRG